MNEVKKHKTSYNTIGGILRLHKLQLKLHFLRTLLHNNNISASLTYKFSNCYTLASDDRQLFTIHPINDRDCNCGNGGGWADRKLSL